MPFTASLGPEKANNGVAPCSPLIQKGTWRDMHYKVQNEYCRLCPYRFMHQPSCSLDFLAFGDIEKFKEEVNAALTWIAGRNPSWDVMNGAFFEVDHAYYLIGKGTPMARAIMKEFVEACMKRADDSKKSMEDFLRQWNHIVEYYGGKLFKVASSEKMEDAAEAIVGLWMDQASYRGKKLYLMYASAAIFHDASILCNLNRLRIATSQLLEAARKAINSQSSLKIS